MDKQSVIGFLLSSAALVLVWFFFLKPSDAEVEKWQNDRALEDSLAQEEQKELAKLKIDSSLIAPPDTLTNNTLGIDTLAQDPVPQVEKGDEKDISFTNEKWELTVSTKGGLPTKLELRDGYVTFQDRSKNVQLWDPQSDKSSMNISFTHNGRIYNTKDLYFTASSESKTITEPSSVVFSSDLGNGSKIEIAYQLFPDRYDTDMTVNLINAGEAGSKVLFDWNTAALHQEKGIYNEQLHSSVFFKTFEDGRDYLGEAREDEETVEDKLNWVCHKQNYFSVIAISESGFGKGGFLKSYPALEEDSTHSTYYESNLLLSANHSGNTAYPIKLFMGPNDLKVLEALETDGVVKIPDYGWSLFGWVNRNIIAPFFNWMSNNLGLSAGLLIFLLTLVVKTVLFPVQWKNYFNSAKMKVLRPEIEEINKKYENKTNSAMEKQQETMALYRKSGVNPMAGCLPALLQMPILYAMFRFFPANIDLRQKEFLWADDLGSYDAIINLPWDIPLYGAHVSGFTVLMAISMFFYTRMSSGNMPTSSQPGMPNMKIIMNIFPVMMLVFFNKFASGLSLYYFLANIFSIGQMLFIKRFLINETKIRATIEENKKKPAKKKSAFAQRLEEMQKEQQKKMKEQKKKKK